MYYNEGNKKTITPLSRRQLQIIVCIANGERNREIAQKFGISEQTIKNQVSAILRKLNASGRAHAVALAIHNQLVTVDEK